MFQVNAMQKEYLFKYTKMFVSLLKGEKPDTFEFTYRHKNGRIRWADARFSVIKTGGKGREIIVILREITEKKENDIKLLTTLNDLERSNKELDDYTFAVSHDLKAPLRTIDSFSSFLLDDYSDALDDTGKEYLIKMKSATHRMHTLIEDLLTMSRVGRIFTEFEFVNLNELIGEIEQDYKTLILEKDSKIILGELPTIKTQRIWIKQVFSNLLSNGLKFNKSKNPKIWIKYEEKEDTQLFSVTDNGIGIEKRHEEKIFSLFQRLHTQEDYPGSGAGLTICKKIVESLGGKIWFESEIDKGTTFFFTLLKENTKPENIEDHQNISDQMKDIHNLLQ
jgi:light-regulated signal transduction histidine kinase (bacteriophytochrome)